MFGHFSGINFRPSARRRDGANELCGGRGSFRGFIVDDAVSSCVLGLVECAVGAVEELLDGHSLVAEERAYTEAAGEVHLSAGKDKGLEANGIVDRGQAVAQAGDIHLRHDEEKLFAAITADGVVGADRIYEA